MCSLSGSIDILVSVSVSTLCSLTAVVGQGGRILVGPSFSQGPAASPNSQTHPTIKRQRISNSAKISLRPALRWTLHTYLAYSTSSTFRWRCELVSPLERSALHARIMRLRSRQERGASCLVEQGPRTRVVAADGAAIAARVTCFRGPSRT